jgi:exodeoxyribonuclease VII large subunit
MDEEKKIYTLTQLNTSLEQFITKNFGSTNFWVAAEVTKISSKNGNTYLELVDSVDGVTTAIMSANLWVSRFNYLKDKLGPDLLNILKAGNKVLFQLRIDFNKVYGLKLVILDIDAAYSHGEMERKKQETIKELKKFQLYGRQKELSLPVVARRIAVIGSPGTSGYRDFLKELFSNKVYNKFQIKEFSASVQGNKAVPELIQALQEARAYDVDVIVFIRGGGSKMDLNAFNDYELNKEICKTKIPVLTGIGHESDEVVSDLICNLNCITPTAAAKHLYVQIGIFSSSVQQNFDKVLTNALSFIGGYKDEFSHICKYLVHNSQQLAFEGSNRLNTTSHKLHSGFIDVLHKENLTLDSYLSKGASSSLNLIELTRDVDLPAREARLDLMVKNLLHQNDIRLSNIEDTLNYVDPKKLLAAGYTVSTIEGKDALEVRNIVGKEMVTLASNKMITSTITKTENQK